MKLTQEDFYCGAFLSYLLYNGIRPALFEDRIDPTRRVYDFTTDKGDFRVYVKSTKGPVSENSTKQSLLWSFPFTEGQIDEIKSLGKSSRQLYFVFICGQPKLNESRIAVVPADKIFQCIDLNRENRYKPQSVKIRLIKGEWSFRIYGTARNEITDGRDSSLKERVSNIDDLFAGASV